MFPRKTWILDGFWMRFLLFLATLTSNANTSPKVGYLTGAGYSVTVKSLFFLNQESVGKFIVNVTS